MEYRRKIQHHSRKEQQSRKGERVTSVPSASRQGKLNAGVKRAEGGSPLSVFWTFRLWREDTHFSPQKLMKKQNRCDSDGGKVQNGPCFWKVCSLRNGNKKYHHHLKCYLYPTPLTPFPSGWLAGTWGGDLSWRKCHPSYSWVQCSQPWRDALIFQLESAIPSEIFSAHFYYCHLHRLATSTCAGKIIS